MTPPTTRSRSARSRPLVAQLQETPTGKVNALLVERIRGGTDLKTLTAAAALANARSFGGEDYVGFHTLMALGPAYRMSLDLPASLAPLPVMKVLYRNTNRIQEHGGRKDEVLHPIAAEPAPSQTAPTGESLRDAIRARDLKAAERNPRHHRPSAAATRAPTTRSTPC